MKVQSIITDETKRYIVIDDDYNVIIPIKKYLKYLDIQGKSPFTLKTYASHLKIFCEYLVSINLNIYSIFEQKKGYLEILVDYISWLKIIDKNNNVTYIDSNKNIRSNKTINGMLMPVIGMYEYLSANKEIPSVCFYKEKIMSYVKHKGFLFETIRKRTTNANILRLKEIEDESYEFVNREQYNILYKACKNRRDKLILALMFECGIRIGEAIGIHVEDCEPWDGRIIIRHRENLINDARVKNKSEGVVYMPDYVIELMIDYLSIDIVDIQTDILFVNLYRGNIGAPITRVTIEKLFNRLSKKTNINVHPHMLRHGFATEKNEFGVDIVDLKALLRHKSIQSTMIYTHVTNDRKKQIVEKFYKAKEKDFEDIKKCLGGTTCE